MKNAIIFDFTGTLVKMRPSTLLLKKDKLNILSKKNSLIIITGAKRSETINILNKLNIVKYFSLVITIDDSKYRKPNRKLFVEIKRKIRFNKAIYIGDSYADYLFANNSSIPFLYVGKQNLGIQNNQNINKLLNYLIDNFPDNI